MLEEVERMSTKFDIDNVGPLTEYLWCIMHFNDTIIENCPRSVTMTQPTLIQRLTDEFNPLQTSMTTPGAHKTRLLKAPADECVPPSQQKEYRSIVGILIHIARWTRPDVMNAAREAAKHMQVSAPAHMRYLNVQIGFLTRTKGRGWILEPKRTWDKRDKTFKFRINGKPDSDYATCTETRRSVAGFMVWLEGALISIRSVMQKIVALSSAEAELIALVMWVQEMMFVKKLIESLELQVELPMLVQCDNKTAVDLVNGHQSAGGTKHIDVRLHYAREMKETALIRVKWISTELNEVDVLIKNTDQRVFSKHCMKIMNETESA